MTSAADLSPGDTYRAADGIPHTVKDVWSGGLRCYIVHTTGEERILFPHTRVTLEEPNPGSGVSQADSDRL